MEPSSPAAARRRVLVMDDEPLVRAATLRLLNTIGYEAEGVSDGDAALARYAEARGSGCPFGAVLLDLHVSKGMDGFECLRRLLALDPAARVILSSGYTSGEEGGPSGAAAMLVKPYTLAALSDTLARVFGGAPPAAPR